jgi:DNA-binding helix-hairpin-helix protein with protein kinase domain
LQRPRPDVDPLILVDGDGNTVPLADELSAGGEGRLYALERQPALAAKVYFGPSPERHRKLVAMIANPPGDPTLSQGHVSICWPTQLLFRHGVAHAAGFLMHRVDRGSHVPVFHMYNPKGRQALAPGFSWRYLARTASNIASVVESLHASGYVLGDINESNFLVSPQALVTLVDCDSMQVPAPGGTYFRCPVGKGDFTAPELQGRSFGETDRTASQDCFALAVLIFLLLMEGTHPFAGAWQVEDEDRSTEERIAHGDCAYAGSRNVLPPPGAPPIELLPDPVRTLFLRCFGPGLSNSLERPSAREWREALQAMERELVICRRNPRHVHARHWSHCPWCERAARLQGADPFPAPAVQQGLLPISFVRSALERPRPAAATRTRPESARRPAATPAHGWRRGRHALVALLLLGVAGAFATHFLTGPPSPQEEERQQTARIAQLRQDHQLVLLKTFEEDGQVRRHLLESPGTATQAVQGFSPTRPRWTSDADSCDVPRGTPLQIKGYIDNAGHFAINHYSAVVSVPSTVCHGQSGLVIAPMSALPRSLRLLDCPGRGGSLQGFAWHGSEEWSCGPPVSQGLLRPAP